MSYSQIRNESHANLKGSHVIPEEVGRLTTVDESGN